MARIVLIAAALALVPSTVQAQSTPNFSYGQVPTAGQWNAAFASKQDTLRFTPLNSAGGTMLGRLQSAPSTVNGAGFAILPGTAPSSPTNGDMWATNSGLFARVGGQTLALGAYNSGAVAVTGGTINGTSIGGTSPATGSFSSLTSGPIRIQRSDGSLSILTGALASTKNVFVAVDGNDTNDGLSPLSPKATLQAAVNAASPNGRVTPGVGTYALSATLFMQPGVKLACVPGAKIMRVAGATFSSLIDFDTNAASGGGIEGCAVDDNLAANSANANGFTVNVGNANDVRVTGNTILNSLGYSIYIRNGLRPFVVGNVITRSFVSAVSVIPGVPAAPVNATITDNVMTGPFGQHALILNRADNSVVARNRIISTLPQVPIVNTSGSSVTWVSGIDFSGVYPGQFITLNGGQEYYITSKSSNTLLTVNSSIGTLSNAQSVIGDGDLISAANMQHSIISENYVYGGGAGGIVVSNFISAPGNAEDYAFNTVSNNQVTLSGAACISIQAMTTSPATSVYDNLISGNMLNRCGVGKTAGNPTNQAGISLFDFTGSGGLARTTIVNNVVRDDLGSTLYGISLSGVSPGQVYAGNNNISGAVNSGIGGGIAGITLSAGWGSAAAVSNIKTSGSSYSFTITSGGTGQASTPTVTISTPATTVDQPPIQTCKIAAGTGAIAPIFGEQNAGAASQTLAYAGTPVSGATYTIYCR